MSSANKCSCRVKVDGSRRRVRKLVNCCSDSCPGHRNIQVGGGLELVEYGFRYAIQKHALLQREWGSFKLMLCVTIDSWCHEQRCVKYHLSCRKPKVSCNILLWGCTAVGVFPWQTRIDASFNHQKYDPLDSRFPMVMAASKTIANWIIVFQLQYLVNNLTYLASMHHLSILPRCFDSEFFALKIDFIYTKKINTKRREPKAQTHWTWTTRTTSREPERNWESAKISMNIPIGEERKNLMV